MTKNIEQIFFFSFIVFFLMHSAAFAAEGSEVGTWYGYAYTDNARAANGTYVAAHLNASSTATATVKVGDAEVCELANCTGFYYINVQANTSYNVTFKICGIAANTTAPSWSSGAHSHLDLYINKSANAASCTYSCGCSGGRCCSGATEYTDGSGTGTCQASACTAAATTTAPPSGGGGGGGVAAATTTTTTAKTTTTTTTIAPPVEETTTVASTEAEGTAAFTYTTEGLAITEISVQVANAVSNVQIKVTKTDAAPATLAIAAPDNVYAYLQIEKTNIEDEDITSVTIKFKVEKSWVSANGIDLATIVLNRYVDGAWTSLATTLTDSDDTYYYFEATSPGLSVFAITAKKAAVTTTTTTVAPPIVIPTITTEWIVAVLLVLIVIGILIYFWRKKSLRKKPAS